MRSLSFFNKFTTLCAIYLGCTNCCLFIRYIIGLYKFLFVCENCNLKTRNSLSKFNDSIKPGSIAKDLFKYSNEFENSFLR